MTGSARDGGCLNLPRRPPPDTSRYARCATLPALRGGGISRAEAAVSLLSLPLRGGWPSAARSGGGLSKTLHPAQAQLHTPRRSRARVFAKQRPSKKSEGAGNAGCQTHPRFRVKKTHEAHHRFAGRSRHSLRDGVTAYSGLSLVIGLSCHHPRAMRKHCRELTPASRHQDHTASPSASCALVISRLRRPSLPASNVRDDRETPLLIGRGMGRILPVIWQRDQPQRLRPINTTGKSVARAEIVSSDRQLLFSSLSRAKATKQSRIPSTSSPGLSR